MARSPRKTKTEPGATSSLLNALKFISLVQADEGQVYETHCILSNKAATAFNGVLAAGQIIEEDINICPHTLKLSAALARCGETLSITQLDNFRLSIKSENFKAVIACANPMGMTYAQPDAPTITINDNLKKGFDIVSVLVSDNSEHVVTASILLKANSMYSTNRHVMFEYWHGIDMPDEFAIPKAALIAVSKSGKTLEKMGYSDRTVTFWFTDGSWLRTQKYNDKWPNVNSILNINAHPQPIPINLFKGINAIKPFAEASSKIFINEGQLATETLDNAGATYDIEGLPAGITVSYKYMQLIEAHALSIDFDVEKQKRYLYFCGENIRGVIMGMV